MRYLKSCCKAVLLGLICTVVLSGLAWADDQVRERERVETQEQTHEQQQEQIREQERKRIESQTHEQKKQQMQGQQRMKKGGQSHAPGGSGKGGRGR